MRIVAILSLGPKVDTDEDRILEIEGRLRQIITDNLTPGMRNIAMDVGTGRTLPANVSSDVCISIATDAWKFVGWEEVIPVLKKSFTEDCLPGRSLAVLLNGNPV
ncbi:MAG: hypothetical protein KGH93_01565 [Patescibacteria group bacterium]|nr:hypothetical protein [Patescibacteria group bacterium]MDE1945869.1 hypothetical protein [Patescibacteria group bacterium]